MTENTIEISVKRKLVRVPFVEINGRKLVVNGKWLKIASVHDEWWLDSELEDPEACVELLKERLRADIFTFTQQIPGSEPRFRYRTEMESVAVAATTNFKTWWEGLPQETRKNVRRSQKRGVTVTVKSFDDELIREIMEVNNESPIRQGVRNAQYGKSFEQTRSDYSAFVNRSDFICTYFEGEMIGFLKMVNKGKVAAILNIATKTAHNDKRPANALIAKAVELCEVAGVSFLTYGLFNYGNKRDSPLREFKIRNGFQEKLTPRFYIPLTPWGTACIKMNFHRGLLGFLPSSVITILLNVRARWYNLVRHSKPV